MATYFDRSNTYAAGVFYDRTNLYGNTQTITLSGVDLTYLSLAYNAPFAVVDGDTLTVPTVVAGSALTVDASGRFVFTPEVPNGTTFTRSLFDVSASTNYDETITINNTTSGISISASSAFAVLGTARLLNSGSVTVSGAGAFTVSGTGVVTPAFNGSVSVSSTGAFAVSGNGVVTPTFSGSVSVGSTGNLTVNGTASTQSNGDIVISSTASITVTGTASTNTSGTVNVISAGDFIVAGHISIAASSGPISVDAIAAFSVRGTSSGRQFTIANNRIFVFD